MTALDPAADEYRDYFMREGCPVLALELHDMTGYPLAVLYDDGLIDDWGQGPQPTPAHVFVIDPDRHEALDVLGRRPVSAVGDHFHDLIDARVQEISVSDLRSLMGDNRPFYAADDEVRGWARDAITRMRLS